MSIIGPLRQGIITLIDGEDIIISNYVDDKKEGKEIIHFPGGYIICNYENDIKHGPYEYKDPIHETTGQYYNGLKEGIWVYINEFRTLKETYKAGEIVKTLIDKADEKDEIVNIDRNKVICYDYDNHGKLKIKNFRHYIYINNVFHSPYNYASDINIPGVIYNTCIVETDNAAGREIKKLAYNVSTKTYY